MELEWDEDKRQLTLRERGLDFADFELFEADSILTTVDGRKDYGEPRFNSTGILDGILCTVCWTPRNGKVRVISMRKINARERETYERYKRIADT
jgi:uncharacterized protein